MTSDSKKRKKTSIQVSRKPIRDLAKRIVDTRDTREPITQKLTTSQQVLARITEGIYRQPSSALRELISNAYDADATSVTILTDAPRFATVIVRDNGIGLSPEALANLITNIGESPKRSELGADLGVTDARDVSLSKAGRKLIGRLGIGLFSVAQLTRHFQVITKTEGASFRTIADITLNMTVDQTEDAEFQTGEARVWTESAKDLKSHGTEVILLELRKRTRDELASIDRWELVDAQLEDGALPTTKPPVYHFGRVSKDNPDVLLIPPNLPWTTRDNPNSRFRKLTQAMLDEVGKTESNPSLESTLDNYLRLLWTLSLAAPVDYVEGCPFDLKGDNQIRFFEISNDKKGQARELDFGRHHTIRTELNYEAPLQDPKGVFEVFVDGVQLLRPIRYGDLPTSKNVIKTQLLFTGKYAPSLEGFPAELSGGPLSIEGYLFWTPIVVPKEHRGIMIRIGNASGTLFDPTFMGYQVSEQNRLQQLTGEIFVLQGLESAINIDRESFNYSHPHYQIIVKWLHNAIKQFTNKQKSIGKSLRETRLRQTTTQLSRDLQRLISAKLKARGITEPPEIVLVDDDDSLEAVQLRKEGALVFSRKLIFPIEDKAHRKTAVKKTRDTLLEQKVQGAIQLLDAWGVLEGLSYSDQQELLRDLIEVLVLNTST